MCEEEEDPCAFCIYGEERIEPVNGRSYYVCVLDDDPDNYLNARCCNGLQD